MPLVNVALVKINPRRNLLHLAYRIGGSERE